MPENSRRRKSVAVSFIQHRAETIREKIELIARDETLQCELIISQSDDVPGNGADSQECEDSATRRLATAQITPQFTSISRTFPRNCS
ncbi:MAG: hypothetical protein WD065_10785, partial [Planctomycetaceae bacterium]